MNIINKVKLYIFEKNSPVRSSTKKIQKLSINESLMRANFSGFRTCRDFDLSGFCTCRDFEFRDFGLSGF